jgi:hypothetical protein
MAEIIAMALITLSGTKLVYEPARSDRAIVFALVAKRWPA